MSCLRRGSHPGWLIPTWRKAIMVYHDEATKDWLAARVPTLSAWEVSRLKLVNLELSPPTGVWWPDFPALRRMRNGT